MNDAFDPTVSLALGTGMPPAPLIAGRYRVGDQLGQGGGGSVYRVHDELRDRAVALKLLHGISLRDHTRVRREIAALRLLRLPGVVRLLDQGHHEGTPFLVTELVEGQPFPGAFGDSWDDLAETTVALLEIIARVHAAGILHRDLKPANVLVDATGRPTVLDFGLSAGPALGRRVTATGIAVGTPAWFAPEQWRGVRADPRTDLYALGLMVYAALTGSLPHTGGGYDELVIGRTTQRPDTLARKAPGTPAVVVATVDALLSLEPDDRPPSASAVLAMLRGAHSTSVRLQPLPRLGGPGPVDAVAGAVREGRSVRVGGSPGCGTTRLLQDVAEALRAEGRTVRRTVRGERALASVRSLLDDDLAALAGGLDAVLEEVERLLTRRLAEGLVVLVDEPASLDPWSRSLLERCWSRGGIVQATRELDADVSLPPIAEDDLQPLFVGPEPIFHLRTDPARELHLRSDGVPARIDAEVRAWVRAGLAAWSGGRLEVSRAAVDRLRAGLRVGGGVGVSSRVSLLGLSDHLRDLLAWLHLAWPHGRVALLGAVVDGPAWRLEADLLEGERLNVLRRRPDGLYEPLLADEVLQGWLPDRRAAAHMAIAAELPADSLDRLFHLASAGAAHELAAAAIGVVSRSEAEGRLGDALAALTEALASAREVGAPDAEVQLLEARTRVALASGAAPELQRGLYELGRAAPEIVDRVQHFELLLRAAGAANEGDHVGALALARSIAPFADERTERWRQAIRARAAAGCGPEVQREELLSLETWARDSGDAEAIASVASWRGMERFRTGEFDVAASLHRSAASETARLTARLSALVNAASADLEAGAYDSALATAGEAVEEAATRRHPMYEARALRIVRAAALRGGHAPAPEPWLVDAVARLELPHFEGSFSVNEAAIAREAGALGLARTLAMRGAAAFDRAGQPAPRALALALAAACGEDVDLSEVWPAVAETPVLDALAQVVCLALEADRPVPPECLARARDIVHERREDPTHQGLLSWRRMAEILVDRS